MCQCGTSIGMPCQQQGLWKSYQCKCSLSKCLLKCPEKLSYLHHSWSLCLQNMCLGLHLEEIHSILSNTALLIRIFSILLTYLHLSPLAATLYVCLVSNPDIRFLCCAAAPHCFAIQSLYDA